MFVMNKSIYCVCNRFTSISSSDQTIHERIQDWINTVLMLETHDFGEITRWQVYDLERTI